MDSSTLYLGLGYLGAGIGAGLTLIGAGVGIGLLAAAFLEGTARQPEAAATLRTSMLIPAALIEGLGLFALVICFLVAVNKAPEASAPADKPAATAAH